MHIAISTIMKTVIFYGDINGFQKVRILWIISVTTFLNIDYFYLNAYNIGLCKFIKSLIEIIQPTLFLISI